MHSTVVQDDVKPYLLTENGSAWGAEQQRSMENGGAKTKKLKYDNAIEAGVNS